jgi:nucleoside-diphosphate-sugar epimerase
VAINNGQSRDTGNIGYTRRRKKREPTIQKHNTLCAGSIVDKDLVNRACKGTDSVLHVASLIDATMFPNEKLLHEINVKGNTSFHYFYDKNHRSRDTKGVLNLLLMTL